MDNDEDGEDEESEDDDESESDEEDEEYNGDDDDNDDDDGDNDDDEEDDGDEIDPEEIEDLRREEKESDYDQNLTTNEDNGEQQDGGVTVETVEDGEESEDDDDSSSSSSDDDIAGLKDPPRRSTRARTQRTTMDPDPSSKSYDSKAPSHHQHNQSTRFTGVRFEEDQREGQANLEYCHNLIAQVSPNPDDDLEYEPSDAMVIARIIEDINSWAEAGGKESHGQQHILQKGLKLFGERGRKATMKEIDQLVRRVCFVPISVKELTSAERRKAMEALVFLTEKRCGTIKGRLVYNGKPTREWLSREESASPTASLESIMLLAVIDAKEERDVQCYDVPNAFIQAELPQEKGQERVIMKITGVLVDLLIQIAPQEYGPHVVYEKGRKVLYVQVVRALYGMLVAALTWYKKFRKDLEEYGFKFNAYDPCVATRRWKGNQQTIRFHVDDLMASHVDKRANEDLYQWLQKMYGNYGDVTKHTGKVHDYLGMIIDFREKGKVKFDMTKYVKDMIKEFPLDLKSTDTVMTPATEDLFTVKTGKNVKKLQQHQQQSFHTVVAKGLFLCKRARPDIQPTIAWLCSRVKEPDETDWEKLVRLIKYLNGTQDKVLTLSADNLRVLKWFVDASFAVHPDFKSHTGATMTMGKGAIMSISRKQKLNTRSSTEAELVGVDDIAVMILWTKLFLEDLGYLVDKNILYQDNKSAILLEENGKKSSGKRTRALNVRYFFMTDQIEKGNVSVEYCPTDDMTSDFMTKPLQGEKFRKFRREILGED